MNGDLDLVQRVLRRQPEALQDIVQRLRCVPRMLAVRNARLAAPLGTNDLADLSQEVIAKVWEQLHTFRGEAALETWLHRFCELTLMNALRRRRRTTTLPVADTLPEPDGAGGLDGSELEHVYRALARLGAEEADVVRAKHFHDETFEAIALRLEQSTSTVKSRYYRALDKLRVWLRTPFGEVAR